MAAALLLCLAAWVTGAEVPPATLPFAVAPDDPGRQLVRVALPFPPGLLREGQGVSVRAGQNQVMPALRVLTWHPGAERSVRRALLTFPYTFPSRDAVSFVLAPGPSLRIRPALVSRVNISGESISIAYPSGPSLRARLTAPQRTPAGAARIETVESNPYFLWRRIHLPDANWPRVLEVREDALGLVAVVAHLQRNLPGDGSVPDFGWEIEVRGGAARLEPGGGTHEFAGGEPAKLSLENGRYLLYHPTAPMKRRGRAALDGGSGVLRYSYTRAEADEKVPMQEATWRRAEFVVAPDALPGLRPTLQYPLQAGLDWRLWDALYDSGEPVMHESPGFLSEALRFHREAVLHSVAIGDDWGNITGYNDASPAGSTHGMNRLNHCPPIFDEGHRAADRRLVEAAILWCDNFYDLSIWWGQKQKGGTRYNDVGRRGTAEPADGRRPFMWRSNNAVDFCTKGFDSFFTAYEETGDPRMREALDAQVRYCEQYVHSDRGECRNIGVADDFMRLYRFTGNRAYVDQALRLFRELRTKLSAENLFSQGGEPIESDPPFIDDDQTGYKHPFAKPLMIGYALLGLPALARVRPNEPRLRDTVGAVADFLAASQDPSGGWRYPHPRSAYVNLQSAMQHASQLVAADSQLGVNEAHLDAIERVLRQRILALQRSGRILDSLGAWEMATGKVRNRKELYQLYRRPADRDADRDYAEGLPRLGTSSPEGLVYFPEVLRFYLKHRAGTRLLETRAGEPLERILGRISR